MQRIVVTNQKAKGNFYTVKRFIASKNGPDCGSNNF